MRSPARGVSPTVCDTAASCPQTEQQSGAVATETAVTIGIEAVKKRYKQVRRSTRGQR
jgi:hypothetical protein